MDHLPTSTNPARRSVSIGSIMCNFCGAYEESVEHLLVSCGMTQTIWDFINTWYMLYGFFFFEFQDQLKFYKQARGSVKWRKVVYSIILTVVWCIWRSQNNIIFNRKQPKVESLK